MTKANYTHLVLVVDRSGSMEENGLDKESTISIRKLFEDQAKIEGDMTVSLYQFDNLYEKVFGPIGIQNVPQYTLVPRNMTALYDSVYRAINETGEFLRNLPDILRPSNVIFTIVTDGKENASHQVSHATMKNAIDHQIEKYGWQFVFMASGINAKEVGESYGIRTNYAMSASAGSYGAAYGGLNTALIATRTVGGSMESNTISSDFTDDNLEDGTGTASWQPPQQQNP